jgi:hypothetical protein
VRKYIDPLDTFFRAAHNCVQDGPEIRSHDGGRSRSGYNARKIDGTGGPSLVLDHLNFLRERYCWCKGEIAGNADFCSHRIVSANLNLGVKRTRKTRPNGGRKERTNHTAEGSGNQPSNLARRPPEASFRRFEQCPECNEARADGFDGLSD